MRSSRLFVVLVLAAAVAGITRFFFSKDGATPAHTVASRVAQFGDTVRERLLPEFEKAGVPYPPSAFTLAAFKDQKTLELYAANAEGRPIAIRSYRVLAASGGPGPKLREGDCQVPEGVYAVENLNPNSRFHLALRVNYPSPEDRRRAQEENRGSLGSDIMIHGGASSIGCLAVGDRAAEDLFILAALTGVRNITLILAPTDFRENPNFTIPPGAPAWTESRYEQMKKALEPLQPLTP
jgi:hypothetical protein